MGPTDLQLKIASLQFFGFTWLFVIFMRRTRHRLSRAGRLTSGSFVIETTPIMNLRLCLHVFTHFACGTRGRVSSSDVSRARTSRKNLAQDETTNWYLPTNWNPRVNTSFWIFIIWIEFCFN